MRTSVLLSTNYVDNLQNFHNMLDLYLSPHLFVLLYNNMSLCLTYTPKASKRCIIHFHLGCQTTYFRLCYRSDAIAIALRFAPIFVFFSDLSKIFTSADQHSCSNNIFLEKRTLCLHFQQFTFRRPINTAVIQTDERKCLLAARTATNFYKDCGS